MPIEFQCPLCQAILRVSDDAVGKRAKCPRCGQIVTVAASQPGDQSFGSGPALPPAFGVPPVPPRVPEVNPYAPPQTPVSYVLPIDRGVIQPQIISFSDVFNTTWRLFFDNFGVFLGMAAIVLGVSVVGNIILDTSAVVISAAEDEAAAVVFVALFILLMLVSILVNSWIQGGILRYSIELAKGMKPTFGRILLPIGDFLGYFVVGLFMGLAVFAGLILLLIPGIIVALMFCCATSVFLDGKAGIFESFAVSRDITRGNRLTIFGLFLVNSVLAFLATLFTCGLAGLLALPFFALLQAVIYTKCAGLFASARPPIPQATPMSWAPPASPDLP